MPKKKKKTIAFYGKGLPPKSEMISFVRKGEYCVEINYKERDGLVTSYSASMICHKLNGCLYALDYNEDKRILSYDTQHRETLGPCHRHCVLRKNVEPINLEECGFLNILNRFYKDMSLIAEELGYKKPVMNIIQEDMQ